MAESKPLPRSLPAAAWAIGAAVLNGAGVAPLAASVPEAYKPDTTAQWLDQLREAPDASTLSAALFFFGVLLLIPTSVALGRRLDALPAAAVLSAGALLNAAGSLLPIVVLQYVPTGETGAALGLLGAAIALDAAFNFCLGVGIAGFGLAALRRGDRAWGVYSLVAGALTVPVAGQIVSRASADWLAVAGPLWLIWLVWSGLRLAGLGRGRTA